MSREPGGGMRAPGGMMELSEARESGGELELGQERARRGDMRATGDMMEPSGERVRLERLDKVLSGMGVCSRSEARKLVREGTVAVDGLAARSPDMKIDPRAACVTVRGEAVFFKPFVYLMLNKPAGVLSATRDSAKATVADLVPTRFRHYRPFPVGRLDADTTGLLLMTNDGALAHALLSPRRHIEKEYIADVDRAPDAGAAAAFLAGLELGDGTRCKSAALEVLEALDVMPPLPPLPPEQNGSAADTSASAADVIKSGAGTSASGVDALTLASVAAAPTSGHAPTSASAATPAYADVPMRVRVVLTEGKHHQVKRMLQRVGVRVNALERVRMHLLKLDPELAPGDMRELTDEEVATLRSAGEANSF